MRLRISDCGLRNEDRPAPDNQHAPARGGGARSCRAPGDGGTPRRRVRGRDLAHRRRVVARADPPALRRGDPGRWKARRAVRGLDDGRVVGAKTLTAWGVGSGTHRYTPFSRFAPFSTTPHSPLPHVFHYVHRAPLSFGILVSRRRLAPRAAGAHGREPGIP